MIGHILQHRAKIFQVQQQHALFVGNAEDDVDNAFLHVIAFKQTRQQQRPHFGNCCADGVTLLAQQIPEHDGKFIGLIFVTEILRALDEMRITIARHGDTGEIALHIGSEDRYAGIGEAFGQGLQCHRFASACRAGDQTVTIAHRQGEIIIFISLADKSFAVHQSRVARHDRILWSCTMNVLPGYRKHNRPYRRNRASCALNSNAVRRNKRGERRALTLEFHGTTAPASR